MRSTSTRLALPFGILLCVACGARSPLDPTSGAGLDDTDGSGGANYGGFPGSGGRAGTGGTMMGAGGMMMGTGGTMMGTGGTRPGTGGTILANTGGHIDGGAGGSGGRPGTGGTVMSTGGTFPNTGGQAGFPGTGGQAGYPGTGGRIIGTGGTAGTGGRGGTAGNAGGTVSTGGTAGTGGTIATGGVTGTGGSTCPGLAANEELIDDLNDGDRFIASVNGRAGAWSDSHDSSPNAKMYPDPSTGFVPSATGDSCRKYAAYVSGGGYVLWGSDLWFGLGSPYNASKYTGITFWAKVDAGTSSVVRVAFPDKDTQPDGNLCTTNPSSGPTACFDHYGQRITLGTTWTKYTVRFSSLAQENWGLQGAGFDPSTLYQVLFQIPVGANFGIWIDDVAFTM